MSKQCFYSRNSEVNRGVLYFTAHCYLWINIFARYTSLCLFPSVLLHSYLRPRYHSCLRLRLDNTNARYADIKVLVLNIGRQEGGGRPWWARRMGEEEEVKKKWRQPNSRTPPSAVFDIIESVVSLSHRAKLRDMLLCPERRRNGVGSPFVALLRLHHQKSSPPVSTLRLLKNKEEGIYIYIYIKMKRKRGTGRRGESGREKGRKWNSKKYKMEGGGERERSRRNNETISHAAGPFTAPSTKQASADATTREPPNSLENRQKGRGNSSRTVASSSPPPPPPLRRSSRNCFASRRIVYFGVSETKLHPWPVVP